MEQGSNKQTVKIFNNGNIEIISDKGCINNDTHECVIEGDFKIASWCVENLLKIFKKFRENNTKYIELNYYDTRTLSVDHIYCDENTNAYINLLKKQIEDLDEKCNNLEKEVKKNNKDFNEWLNEAFTNPEQLKAYKEKHFIPDIDLSFGNFEEFLEKREELIIKALKKELI